MVRIVPDGGYVTSRLRESYRLREYNKCHRPAGEGGGQFDRSGQGHCEGGGAPTTTQVSKTLANVDQKFKGMAPGQPTPGDRSTADMTAEEYAKVRPKPIRVETAEEAADLLLQGKHVEMTTIKEVNTLISKLAQMATDAAAKGEKAPNYDLCNVSVAGTNMFCVDKMRNAQYPEGVPRAEMPQMSGTPVPGSPADQLPKNYKGNVDATQAFIQHMEQLGIRMTPQQMPAAKLKATQAELVGPKVASMMVSSGMPGTPQYYDPAKEPIFVSRDFYVVDGHHRWAAVVGRDAADGRLGDEPMNVIHVDAPITEVLRLANDWSKSFGIAQKAGPGTQKLARGKR